MYNIQKRLFDIILSIILIILTFIPCILIVFLIKFSSKGKILFWSDRIGLNNKIFKMPKFRSMIDNTPLVATHCLKESNIFITPIGKFIRRTSIDEIPQLWSIFIGDMSFVGPRPALYSQFDLIELRTIHNIHLIKPGLTGWAQINGRDEITIQKKIELDYYYLINKSFLLDILIIIKTFFKVILFKNISH